jgi:hypothetical protein
MGIGNQDITCPDNHSPLFCSASNQENDNPDGLYPQNISAKIHNNNEKIRGSFTPHHEKTVHIQAHALLNISSMDWATGVTIGHSLDFDEARPGTELSLSQTIRGEGMTPLYQGWRESLADSAPVVDIACAQPRAFFCTWIGTRQQYSFTSFLNKIFEKTGVVVTLRNGCGVADRDDGCCFLPVDTQGLQESLHRFQKLRP